MFKYILMAFKCEIQQETTLTHITLFHFKLLMQITFFMMLSINKLNENMFFFLINIEVRVALYTITLIVYCSALNLVNNHTK